MFASNKLTSLKALTVALQLGLIYWLMIALEVESTLNIAKILPVIAVGGFLQFFVPDSYRRHFFIALSIIGAFALLGVIEALVFLALFTCFFIISQLPLSVWKRAILLLIAGSILAYVWAFHLAVLPGGWISVPIVGSIFMFRLSLYLYDVRFEKEAPPLSTRLAYFLMLPNLVFTLFPVIDYKTFKQSEDFSNKLAVQQKGVHLMIRGFVHLMLYRLIYYYFLPNPTQISSLSELATYALYSYLMILRLSGLFHFAVGVLCLFGFDLPRVFNNYFLASGFSDLWRRINTYWRDYIMKIFYYPIYFQVKKLGQLRAMVVTIWIVFFITWLLHSYQWFWIKGNFPIRMVDAIFWGIFGIMVSASAAQQYYKKKKKIKPAKRSPAVASFLMVLQITAMFSFMCLLWTFWNSPSVESWWNLMGILSQASPVEWWNLIKIILFAIGLGTFLYYVLDRKEAQTIVNPEPGSTGGAIYSLLSLLPFVMFLLQPELFQPLDQYLEKPISHYLENRLNEQDDALMVQGYYEDILVNNNMQSRLSDNQVKPKEFIPFSESDVVRHRDDWMKDDFMPNSSGMLKGFEVNINSWGMRDQEYQLPKPEGTIRMGVFGGSYVAGSGIEDEHIFNRLVNQEFSERPYEGYKIELLNFGVPGFHLLENAHQFEEVGLDKELNLAVFVMHATEFYDTYKRAEEAVDDPGFSISIKRNFRSLSLNDEADEVLNKNEVRRRGQRLTEYIFSYISARCRLNNIVPVLIYWPRTVSETSQKDYEHLIGMTEKKNLTFIDLAEVYRTVDTEQIIVSTYDRHPNKLGHQLVADAIVEKIRTLPAMKELVDQLNE